MSSNYMNYVQANAQTVAGVYSGNPVMAIQGATKAMSILGNIFGSGSSSNATQRLNRADTDWMYGKQSDYWKANTEWFNENGYSMLRHGLEKAGYNPLMALGAQPLSGATVSGSAVDSTSASKSFDLPQAFNAVSQQLANTHADTLLKHAQVDETYSRSALENSQRILNDDDIPYRARRNEAEVIGLETENRKKEAEIRNIEADTGVKLSTVQLNRIEMQYKKVLMSFTKTQQAYVSKISEKISQGMTLTDPEVAFVKNNPKLSQFYAGLRQFGNAFGSILHNINFNSYDTYNVGD